MQPQTTAEGTATHTPLPPLDRLKVFGWALVATCLLQIPSLRTIDQYVDWPWAAILMLGAGYLLGFELYARGSRVLAPLDTRVVPALLLIGFWIAILIVYPHVKANPNSPTSDTALIAPIKALQLGRAMYDLDGLIDVPASPGPGWVLVNAPLSFLGVSQLYTLLTPVWVIVSWAAMRWSGESRRTASLWCLLAFSSPLACSIALAGYDIPVLGLIVTALSLGVERIAQRPLGAGFALLALAVGAFATARIVFLVLPVLYALVIWRHDKLRAILFLLASLGVALALHAAFYVQPGGYDPLHLLNRAQNRTGDNLLLIGAGGGAALFLGALIFMTRNRENQLAWFCALFATPLAIIALGEYLSVKGDLKSWEAANYLLPAAGPVLLLALRSLQRGR